MQWSEETERALIQQKQKLYLNTHEHAYVRCYDTYAPYIRTHSHAVPGHWKYEIPAFPRPSVTNICNLPAPLTLAGTGGGG